MSIVMNDKYESNLKQNIIDFLRYLIQLDFHSKFQLKIKDSILNCNKNTLF